MGSHRSFHIPLRYHFIKISFYKDKREIKEENKDA